MKTLLLLLFPLFGWGQSKPDTMSLFVNWGSVRTHATDSIIIGCKTYEFNPTPVTVLIQYTSRDAIMVRDCYLINGEPWYRSTAPLTRGKWIKIRAYRWRISEGWIKQNKT